MRPSSQQSPGPQPDRGDDCIQWPPGHAGRSQGVPPPPTRASGHCTRAVCRVGCLCLSALQEGKPPLLRAWFGCHCCQEKEAPSYQHNHPCFSHPPFLMWQLSACHSARCQGNPRRQDGCGTQVSRSPGARGGGRHGGALRPGPSSK